MHIAVLAKVVPDYEVPAGDFELSDNRAHSRYTRMMGLYDENAIETGVQLKEKYSASLTIISYGAEDDIPVLRKAIAMGAEKLVLVTGQSDDASVIAANLKMAIDNLGDVDLILAGQQSADMDRGVVHGTLAEMLGLTFIPQVSKIESENGGWKISQLTETGSRDLQFNGKGVFSITSIPENVPRIPAVRAIFAAKKKPVEKVAEVESNAMGIEEVSVEIPTMDSVCEFLPVEDVGETVKTLLTKLREERYL
ncbi:electron transfer flavoprotein beta subunit/FixA family protein [Desulfonema magnum]|nr:electron transfer flavoprotein beta subunit/FixA family protein [Desulfonema magnum]